MHEAIPGARTVEEGLSVYLSENGFDPADYDAPWVHITILGVTFPFPNPPQRQRAVRLHDLHHVITGFGTDLAGEAEISAWELRRGLRGLGGFVKAIVITGTLGGLLHSPRRTFRAWRASGAGGNNLFAATIDHDYPRLLERTLADLRRELGVPTDGLASRHALHSAAPRREASATR